MWFAALTMMTQAAAAPCADWSSCPVATDLHPVSWSYPARYDAALQRVMGSRRSSPLFSSALNEAEAHWRLVAATGRGLELSSTRATAWRDLAFAGSFLAFDQVIDETVARSDEVQVLRNVIDSVVAPSAEAVITPNGKVRVAHPTGGAVKRKFQRAEEELGLDGTLPAQLPDRALRRSPPVKISGGVGWKLRDLEAPADAPLLTWNADLAVHNAGLTLWRVDVDLLRFHWDALARQRVASGFSVGTGLHSAEGGPEPARWSAGLFWTPKANHVVSLQRSSPVSADSWRVDLTLRVELGTFLPGRLDPSLAGYPATVDRSPNTLTTPFSWAGDLTR